jgi:transcriptional regulator with XRE-family HTH domain
VATVAEPTSGTGLIDRLIDGVRIGDNLVFQGDDDAPLDLLVDRFVAACRGQVPVVIVTVRHPRQDPVPDGVRVLDWSAVVSGVAAEHPGALGRDATIEDAIAQLHRTDEEVGGGAAFVFDRLTAVEDAWGPDAGLTLFLAACPRLYRRRSLAVWPVDAEHHRPSFLRRLAEVTQVVVELSSGEGQVTCTVRKADGRPAGVVGRTQLAQVVAGDLEALDPPGTTRERLGTMIRDQRLLRGLSQADLARKIGITPSALSQVERGVRGPAGDTLVRIWEVLGVPFGPATGADPGYVVSHRSGRERQHLQDGLTGQRLVDDPATGQVWLLEVDPGATGDRGPFTVKMTETVTVVRGVLDLWIGGRAETLHEGDALLSKAAVVTAWANPGDDTAEVLWTLQPSS